MLNRVYTLCRDTLRITSLDTTTDSNTRERLPYEADGAITGSSRYVFQKEWAWQRHSSAFNFVNPTWPTEWRQFMPLMAYNDYMQTGDLSLYHQFHDLLLFSTQYDCINKKDGAGAGADAGAGAYADADAAGKNTNTNMTTNNNKNTNTNTNTNKNHNLVDFSDANGNCKRSCTSGPGATKGCRDIVDWPQDTRDGYVLSDVSTVINAFAVAGLRAMARMAAGAGNSTESKMIEDAADGVTSRYIYIGVGVGVGAGAGAGVGI
jgi:hypothetical protein